MIFIYERWKVVQTPFFVLDDGREVSHRLVEMSSVLQMSDYHNSVLLEELSGYIQHGLLYLDKK
jgi:hypothetical protein